MYENMFMGRLHHKAVLFRDHRSGMGGAARDWESVNRQFWNVDDSQIRNVDEKNQESICGSRVLEHPELIHPSQRLKIVAHYYASLWLSLLFFLDRVVVARFQWVSADLHGVEWFTVTDISGYLLFVPVCLTVNAGLK